MILVINEWLLHDLRGDNGLDRQRESYEFLRAFQSSSDHTVVLRNSPWMVKAFDLMTYTDPRRRLFGKMLKLSLFDRDITAIFNEDDIVPLPDQLAQQTPAEDHYLVQLYIASDADLLITSDVKLHDALDSVGSINVQLRDDFLQKYLSR